MAAHAAAEHDHHGPPAANASSRVDARTLGMLMFIGSEIMLFGSFFTAYFFVRVVNNPPLAAARVSTCRSSSPASTRRSWSPRASRCTGP